MSIPLPPHSIPDAFPGPPFFGALLRIVWQHVRDRMLQAIHEAGFTDFQEPHFAVFSFPLPDGMRPSELARQKRMSRQAVNYLLSQLEELGYVERRAADGRDRRLVYLTPRGHDVVAAIFACLRQLHEQWSKEVGKERFDDFVDVLKQLSTKAQEPANR
ncbi:MarR family winged helix-turn-helix transcriptional regulator [Rhizobium ruizarguesonis]|uniref:MarR family winged helix-turn-helix transcriptional regulator n=1 Tax=Rhizobium ruizarguesonis TaxID=2081791 RepID=UPI00102FB5E5|nr:MarR family transcriptional regulator [Rhizobium ruizarguesonis]NKL46196.1 MarR family transcriptional regulator [Rhizobium leguminosarum bv. viciae]TAU03567.1 MarR family transcriptional regulator [Rhizobium ruizarguesonis]TAZ38140.1 MarR family transcriptional regulator [Rhizobium ruizarguesonis]TBD19596.1 MarR family transcriptional regulator [Rhizobium ruizarguesonis]TBE04678.1 MarR family transcriptional regulator [Rhizobium ruizarguesonis]